MLNILLYFYVLSTSRQYQFQLPFVTVSEVEHFDFSGLVVSLDCCRCYFALRLGGTQ